jgi:hypothetical protein
MENSLHGAKIMKTKILIIVTFFVLFSFAHSYKRINLITGQENIEHYLRTAQIVSIKTDPKAGRTEAWHIILDDGKVSRRGYFKYVNRIRPAPLADSYKYEIAAYELDKLLNLNIVPPVVEREIKGIKGSLQLFIENCITENYRKRTNIEPHYPKLFQKVLNDINIFENLTYNERSDLNDILIHEKDWKVWRIDFSQAFSPQSELIPGSNIKYCSKKFFQNLLKLDNEIIKAKLKPYLNAEEMRTLLKRKELIIKKIKQLIKEKGEISVLIY